MRTVNQHLIVATWMSSVDFDRNGGKSQIRRRFKRVEDEEFEIARTYRLLLLFCLF